MGKKELNNRQDASIHAFHSYLKIRCRVHPVCYLDLVCILLYPAISYLFNYNVITTVQTRGKKHFLLVICVHPVSCLRSSIFLAAGTMRATCVHMHMQKQARGWWKSILVMIEFPKGVIVELELNEYEIKNAYRSGASRTDQQMLV